MGRVQILKESAPLVDRLRTHAARLVEDHAVNLNGLGAATEQWERRDLERVLDDAADALEALQRVDTTP